MKYLEIEVGKIVIYKNKNVSIPFTSMHGYVLEYDIDLEIENFSSRNLLIMNEEISVNCYMRNEASCYIEVSPGEILGFEKDLARETMNLSPLATVKRTYDIQTENDKTVAVYDSSGKLVDSQKAEYVQVIKGIPTNVHIKSEKNDISKVKSVISDVRKGNTLVLGLCGYRL